MWWYTCSKGIGGFCNKPTSLTKLKPKIQSHCPPVDW